MNTEIKNKLKAFFAEHFFDYASIEGPAWSTLTGGDVEGLSLEDICKAIDEFDENEPGFKKVN